MLSDVQHKLEKSWIMGFQNLRIVNTSENEFDEINEYTIYAIDFHGKPNETEQSFITRFGELVLRLRNKFDLIGACLEFNETPFAIIEFREK